MFSDDWKEIKKTKKVRRISDNTIWEISRIIDGDHLEISNLTTKTKKGTPIKQILSKKSVDFSPVVNSFDIDVSLNLNETIYANTKEEALRILLNHLTNQLEENPEEIIDLLKLEVTKENIVK